MGSTRGPSRSLSPALRSREKADSPYDTIMELQSQLKVKDAKIKQQQETIGYLEAKYPNLKDIVRSRVEEERTIFEEKSEKVRFLTTLIITELLSIYFKHRNP